MASASSNGQSRFAGNIMAAQYMKARNDAEYVMRDAKKLEQKAYRAELAFVF